MNNIFFRTKCKIFTSGLELVTEISKKNVLNFTIFHKKNLSTIAISTMTIRIHWSWWREKLYSTEIIYFLGDANSLCWRDSIYCKVVAAEDKPKRQVQLDLSRPYVLFTPSAPLERYSNVRQTRCAGIKVTFSTKTSQCIAFKLY
jgi:hypothetical protein